MHLLDNYPRQLRDTADATSGLFKKIAESGRQPAPYSS